MKIITLWMTANNVCAELECNGPMQLASYSKKMNQVLANISAWSNVYVSLMGTLDLFASALAAAAERVL